MNRIKLAACLFILFLVACGGKEGSSGKQAAAKAPKGTAFFLAIASPERVENLTADHFRAATLLPLTSENPQSSESKTTAKETSVKKPDAGFGEMAGFSELAIDVINVESLGKGVYRVQIDEPPQVDAIIKIKSGDVILKVLALSTGSEKSPVHVDLTSTAAVVMFLNKVVALHSFNGVDAEQVGTMLSVVTKHLNTLDAPLKKADENEISWYTQQAQKSCSIEFDTLSSSAACAAYTLSGNVKGLIGKLQLSVNQGDPLSIAADGDFMFRTGLINRTKYEVKVEEQPAHQTCIIANGIGRIDRESVSNIHVHCTENRYQLSGLVEGLTGTLTLALNGKAETLSIHRSGAFQLATSLQHGAPYEVTVAGQPDDLTCAVAHGSGYVMDNVGDISILCEPVLFQVGGVVSDLNGTLKLAVNDAEELSVTKNGEFAFGTDFTHKMHYAVSILEQPAGQTCKLAKGNGTVALADIKNVAVTCVTNSYPVGGYVSGLKGSLTLLLNGEDKLQLGGDGEFHFKKPLLYRTRYDIAIDTQPKGQTCEVAEGTGTLSGNIDDIHIACTSIQYKVGGMVKGLAGAFQLRLNNNLEIMAIPGNGPFSFANKLINGTPYRVVVDTQPQGQTCTLRNGAGRIALADISNLEVSCEYQPYKLGGIVNGLAGVVKLSLNGGVEVLQLSSNGMFAWSSALHTGDAYKIAISQQPAGQHCEIANGQGKINATNVVNVKVICLPDTLPKGDVPPKSMPLVPAATEGAMPDAKTFAVPVPQATSGP